MNLKQAKAWHEAQGITVAEFFKHLKYFEGMSESESLRLLYNLVGAYKVNLYSGWHIEPIPLEKTIAAIFAAMAANSISAEGTRQQIEPHETVAEFVNDLATANSGSINLKPCLAELKLLRLEVFEAFKRMGAADPYPWRYPIVWPKLPKKAKSLREASKLLEEIEATPKVDADTLPKIDKEGGKETPIQRRERLLARQNELKSQGVKNFNQIMAKEEGRSVGLICRLVSEAKKRRKKKNQR